jgi:hypothetical protein
MATIAIHHVGIDGGSVAMHAGIAVEIQGRGAFDLIGFRAGDHVRLMSIGDLRQGLKTTSA